MNINEQNLRRRIGSDYLIGSYTKGANGIAYFTDIRGGEGDLVKNPFDSDEDLTISYTGKPLEEDTFYSFNWHLDEAGKSIVIDGDVTKIDNSKFVQGLYEAKLRLSGANLEQFINFQKTIFNEVTGAQHTYIYELLQNANDYPFQGEHVNVKFILTKNYLFFLHSGACFNLRNIVGISSVNQGEKKNNTETIGYKGIGFKTVFVNNEYVYLRSGDWSLRFDRQHSEAELSGECPWSLMPIPTKLSELDAEVQDTLIQNDMRVQFALRHKSNARLNLAQLDKVFSDNQILLFIPNVYRVDVIVDGTSQYVVEKDDKKWVVTDYRYSVPEDLRQWVEGNINSGDKIPEKFKDIHNVRISFAVGRDGNKIVPIENARVYNYLPTELRLGFDFLFNADFVPNGSRSGLHDVEWNDRIMEQCGCQFADWWVSLMENEGEFDLQSVFDLLPDFNNRDHYAKLFINGFKKRIIEIPCIPTRKDGEYRLVTLNGALYDKIGLVTSANPILSDEEFYQYTKSNGRLPHKDIRCHSKLITLLDTFDKSIKFNYSGLDILPLNTGFRQWLKDKGNNIKFNKFLLDSGYIQNLWSREIFLTSDGVLGRAETMYYDIDKYIDDINFLATSLVHVDTEVRDALNRGEHPLSQHSVSHFKRFDDYRFTQSIVDDFSSYKTKFEDKSNSISFIHFLSVTNYIKEIPTDYPLFLDDGTMVYGKNDVYIKNEIGKGLASHSWIDKAWIGFLSEDYFARDKENVGSYLTAKCNIKELTANDCYKLFIANDNRVPFIAKQINDRASNIDFYHYLLSLSNEISNFTPLMRQSYTLLATDGKDESLIPITRTIFWQDEDWKQMSSVEWMPNDCCLAALNVYFDGLSKEDAERLKTLLSTKQVVQKFSIPGLYQSIRTRLSDIFALITTKELSKDFLNFLFTNKKDIFRNDQIEETYKNVPILCKGKDELSTIASAENKMYLPNADLLELYNMPWFNKSAIILCDDYYSDLFDGSERCEFFGKFGLKQFNKFHYIPAHLLNHLEDIKEALSIRENNISFHRYIADCHDRFGERDLAKVKDMPIYIESPNDENGELVDKSSDHYLPSKLLTDIISRDIVPISILDSIHPDYIKSDNDTKYFTDKLGNVEIDEEGFFSYIVGEDNVPEIDKYLRNEERNIRFWQWVCERNINREAKAKLRTYPILARTIGSETNVFVKPEEVYISSTYSDADGIEQFIAQFVDSPKFVSPDYADPEKQLSWNSLFKAIKVTVDYKEIVFKNVLPNLAKYKDVNIVSILAQYTDDFNETFDKKDSKIKDQLQDLQLMCDDGCYRTPKNVVFSGRYFDIDRDPFSEISIGNLISDKYLSICGEDSNKLRIVKRFITFIADKYNDAEHHIKYESITSLRDYKIHQFLSHQETYLISELHFQIVARLAELLAIDFMGIMEVLSNSQPLKIKTVNGTVVLIKQAYLSTIFNPNCDFMGHGITSLDFVSEEYANYSDLDKIKYLFIQLGAHQRFTESHIDLLQNEVFATYFWNIYAVSNEDWIKDICKYDKLHDKLCIPTTQGIRRPRDLYDYRKEDLLKIVKKLNNWEDKIPSVKFPTWMGMEGIGLRSNLYLLDCLEYLSLDTNDFRRKVLEWVIKTPEETIHRNSGAINNYLANANWFNGAKQWSSLSELVALEWGNDTLKDNFGTNAYVCNPSYMPESKADYDRLCGIFHIKVLTNKDFEKHKEGICHYDAKAVKEISKRLIYLAFKTGKKNWQDVNKEYQEKLKISDISTCERIVYSYNENIQNDLCIYAEEDTKLWYQGEWTGFMFQGIVEWIVDKIGVVGDFDRNYLYRLFHTPFNTFVRKEESGQLPSEVLTLLEDEDRIGIDIDEHAHSEEFREDSDKEGELPEQVLQHAEAQRQQRHDNADMQPHSNSTAKGDADRDDSVDSSNQPRDRQHQPTANGSGVGNVETSKPEEKEKQERNNHVPHNYPEQRTTSNRDREQSKPQNQSQSQQPQKPQPQQEPDSAREEKSLEDRLQEKWDKQKHNAVGRPVSSPTNTSWSADDIKDSHRPDNAPSGEPFFNDAQPTHYSNGTPNARTGQNLKRKNTEAQNSAKAAADQESIYDMLNNTPKYTFKWFKLLMELQFADRGKVGRRTAKIDFKEYEKQERADVVRLLYPSTNVPMWLESSNIAEVMFMSNKPLKAKASVINVGEFGVDIIIDKDTVSKLGNVSKIRLLAESTSNIIDSLSDRFIQLDYSDDFDLNAHLPSKVDFIYGPPGTGKTTRLVERLRQIVGGAKTGINILVLTPTNKAADVIATKLIDDEVCGNYSSRFGSTESQYLMSYDDVLYTRDTMDMEMYDNNIIVTTAARYSYDCVQPNDIAICDFDWDYIVVDEASMIDLITITYILHKGKKSKFIIAGDPKQIQPVSQGDVEIENIYQMVGLDSFKDAIEHYDRYNVEALTIQHRSVPAIGNLVSKFSYNDMVQNDEQRAPQKPLEVDGISVKNINFVGFKIEEFDRMYGLTAIKDSAFHLYSAIFTYNMVGYMVEQITKKYPGKKYTIGIVCPYKAEADAIQQLVDNRSLDTDVCMVYSGTVHKFQGDECDIMFIVLNPPANITSGAHINNQNIINVAMSRARDYIFFVLPERMDEKLETKTRIGHIVDSKDRSIMYCSEIEKVMFGNPNYLYENTNVTCHLPVNVYYDALSKYEVRIDDTTLDIEINDDINALKS